MAQYWKFETAAEFINLWAGREMHSNEACDDYLTAEEFLLDHKPTSAEQVITVLDLIIENIQAGTRSDQRDVRALQAISEWLRQPMNCVV